ncbi:unnamed protein product [Mesocestoides corti]|uniref:Cytoplasmic tRNA 2-thiolation protein 2 n=1 Tax=Mesocestoides corti TaxID=53468 RepID=A0A0R3UBD6_MESCO|nr:unnamed protein product [Mesocestoides corti]
MSVPDGLVSISGRSNVTNCIKCKGVNGVPAVFIRKDDPPLCNEALLFAWPFLVCFCRTCFLSGCVHKFRSAFGKANIVRNRDAVALAFSGGASSLAMLQLAKMCHSTSQARKLRFQPTVICLYDVGQPYPHKQEEAMKVVGFDYRIVRTDEVSVCDLNLNTMYCTDSCQSFTIPLDKNEGDFVDQLSASTALTNSALTAAEETLRWRRLKQLVLYTSRSLGHRFLLVGDNASQLAAQCLAGIAQGRGGSVAAELDFADTRFTDVTILRPMFNFLANEVVLFLRYAGLDAVIEPTLSLEQTLARGPGVNSIQRLTQDFISSLQFAGFPSTTKAVLRYVEQFFLFKPNLI